MQQWIVGVEVLPVVWNANKINRLATINETSTFPITENFQHNLKKFPQINIYYAFYYSCQGCSVWPQPRMIAGSQPGHSY